ncbi:hypothetical protein CCP4SC76_6610003 [Gammaproteobacteria bacterium]
MVSAHQRGAGDMTERFRTVPNAFLTALGAERWTINEGLHGLRVEHSHGELLNPGHPDQTHRFSSLERHSGRSGWYSTPAANRQLRF